ncbi:hypothetical protein [uncultured Sneathia sp.]|uniref:hypothetical protein n=1 Tax=uncultured Sneathia sp. TaxID=278067 RepID=UPI0025943C16|nr:hypothetical protein [uncultured Sneathia sp.]
MKKNIKYLKKIQKLQEEIDREKQKIMDYFEKMIDEYNLMEILTPEIIKSIAEQISKNREDNDIYILINDNKDNLEAQKKENNND